MRPKGKLFALVVLFAAVGLLTATGAFTTVEADRTATVETAGDANALLGLEPHQNSELANVNSAGEVEISLNDSNTASADPSGVNTNATTLDDNVLNITNNGQNSVYVRIDSPTAAGEVVFYNATNSDQPSSFTDQGTQFETGGSNLSDVVNNEPTVAGPDGTNRKALNQSAGRIRLDSGSTVVVGIYVETYGVSNGTEVFGSNDITISAVDVDN